MSQKIYLLIFVICQLPFILLGQEDSTSTVTIEPITTIEQAAIQVDDYQLSNEQGKLVFVAPNINQKGKITVNGNELELDFANGKAIYPESIDAKGKLLLFKKADGYSLYHVASKSDNHLRIKYIPFWLSLLPPLLAIFLALLFKEVTSSLFLGILSGVFVANGMRVDSLYYFLQTIFQTVDHYVMKALNDSGHLSVIIFSLLIGGMVAIISRNGGMAGIVNALSRFANSRKNSQLVTWFLGIAIFFDDYANTLIVGNTMRSVTDKFKVSREKLAYIVDSTAAPVAAVAFITTWIGAELGYIGDSVATIDGWTANTTPYALFIQSLKYSFYPILTLIFIFLLIRSGKEYGPMWAAENRAKNTGVIAPPQTTTGKTEELEDLSPIEGATTNWIDAAIPVFLVIFMTIIGLIDTGMQSIGGQLAAASSQADIHSWSSIWAAMGEVMPDKDPSFFLKLGNLIGSADSYVALLWASLSGVIAAIAITIMRKTMGLSDTINTMITGFKTMLPAIVILTLAWSLAGTTESLHTATFLTNALADSINPYLMPPIIFVLAALISFSTGSSWSTMAILYPIAIPTTWAVCQSAGIAPDVAMELLLNVISTVLAASVLGDHCSPISDTTILSSLASNCSHIHHVRTQLPYALTVGAVSITAGTLATILGGGWMISFILLAISIGVLYAIIRFIGKEV